MSKNLPAELIEDILRRLPVKSLKCFRAVSKTWCFLIDSQSFVKSHLRRSLATNAHRHILLGGLGLYTIDLDKLDRSKIVKPPFYYKSVDGVSNTCNGVVLVMSEPAVLWNLFSGSYKVVPAAPAESPPTDPEIYSKSTYGFGYDSKNDDYKVLKVVEYRSERTHVWMYAKAFIYSHSSNLWSSIEDFPYPLPFLKGHWRVQLEGALHTVVGDPYCEESGARIMAFSLSDAAHYEVPMPPGVSARVCSPVVDEIDCKWLSMICATRSRVVMWVMKEYGVRESWTKVMTISSPDFKHHDLLKPLVYSKEGDSVLLNVDDKRLVWYNLKSRKLEEEVNTDGQPFVFYAEVCVESLVSLEDPNSEDRKPRQVKSKGKKIRNKRDDFLSEGFKLVL